MTNRQNTTTPVHLPTLGGQMKELLLRKIATLPLLLTPLASAFAQCASTIQLDPSPAGSYRLEYKNNSLLLYAPDGTTRPDSLERLANASGRIGDWARCHLNEQSRTSSSRDNQSGAQKGGPAMAGKPPSTNSAGLDEVTPQVPGCPKYVSKLNIEWRRKPGANPQLNIWEVRNVSDKFAFRVTYRADGTNTDLPTLNPGDVAEAWGLKAEPPFVVRNFYDMKNWERANSKEKSLECSLAIRPQ